MLTASCLQCGSDKRQAKWGKNRCGSQRYRCQDCHKVYTPEPMVHGYPLSVRQQAVALHVEGLSLRRIARLLSVNAQSVANWLAAHQNALERTAQATLPTDDPGLGACQTVELDELHVFVGARKGEKNAGST